MFTHIPLLQFLSPAEQNAFANTLTIKDLPQGAVLFSEGDLSSHFYIILEGQVQIIKAHATAEESVLGVRGEGEFVGEMGLLNQDARRTATALAMQDSRLYQVGYQDFTALLGQHPILAYELARVLSERMTNAQAQAITTLQDKNQRLQQAYDELKAAQAQIIEKEKLERELELARQIQRSILPGVLPVMAGYDFGALMEPARAVGGDFFGLFPVGEGQLGLVVGDVTDKGVPAALFMAQCHALLRAAASPDRSPGETLRVVNRYLLEMNELGMFVTVLYGVLYGETGVFQYARAGHELLMLIDPHGQARLAELQPGSPLGILEEPLLDENRLVIPPGGGLLIYSDGVPDGANPAGERFGYERLLTAAQANAGQGAQQICASLFQAVNDFAAGEAQFDDLTLLAALRLAA